MPEVLDQSEVDALLAAVDSGEIDFSTAAVTEESTASAFSDVSIYDFKRPERVSKDQLRSLESLHEVFARNFSAALSGYLRTIVDVKLASVEQLTYSEFIMSLPNPTCFNLVSAKPLEGEMILEINPSISYTIIERLLGATNKTTGAPPDRPLTDIELILIKNVTNRAMDQLHNTWSNIQDIDFRIVQTESNPQLMQIVAPNEPVVLISFEVTLGEVTGMINFCIPFLVIEPITAEFSAQTWFGYTKGGMEQVHQGYIQDGLARAVLRATVILAEATINVADLLTLKKGDIIQTQNRVGSEITMTVEGRKKFVGTPCAYRNKKAFQIKEVLQSPRDA